MLRCLMIPAVLMVLPGCFLFGGRDDASPDTFFIEDPDELFIRDCDITCNDDGIDIEIDAIGADEAEVEFFSEAQLVETFVLTQLDDETWVGYPDWPAGYSFADCGADADFVCVIRANGEEVRESR